MRRTALLITAVVVAILLAGGVALAVTPTKQCRAGSRVCYGTTGDDVIFGTNRADTIKARAGRDTVYGKGAGDYILGQDDADILYGDQGKDTLNEGPNPDTEYGVSCGGTGNDKLVESAGQDQYAFQPNWGHDVISGQGEEVLNDGFRFDGLCFPEPLVSADLTINFTSGKVFETSATSFNLSPNTVKWTPGVIEFVYSGSGNDTITGKFGDNEVVHGENGNDIIDVSGDPLQSDFVDCGDGTDTLTRDLNDTVYVNPSTSQSTCETDTVVP